jgi:hypothetical protein
VHLLRSALEKSSGNVDAAANLLFETPNKVKKVKPKKENSVENSVVRSVPRTTEIVARPRNSEPSEGYV